MERILTTALGGEFSRHFWPGLFFGSLSGVALLLNGFTLPVDQESFLALLIVIVPAAVLVGVLLDFLGHLFVLTNVTRLAAIASLRMAPTVLSLLKLRLKPLLGDQVDGYDAATLSEYCFALPRAASTNVIAHQKYEEQFTYYEFNRSICLFFGPLVLYILSLLGLLAISPNASARSRLALFVVYLLVQVLILVLAYSVFHRQRQDSALYRVGRFYFSPIFSVYRTVTTVQLGMLYDYYLTLELPKTESQNNEGPGQSRK